MQVLRRGRSMSQLTATVRNPGADAGLTAIAAFGAPRRGFEFTELVMPDVPRTRRASAASAIRSPRASTSSSTATRCRSGTRSSRAARRSAGHRGSRSRTGPAEVAYWYRLDHPPLAADGSLDVAGAIVIVRHDARARSARSSVPGRGRLVRAERRLHAPRVPAAPARAGSSPTSGPATPATATPASSPPSGTRRRTAPPSSPTPPS